MRSRATVGLALALCSLGSPAALAGERGDLRDTLSKTLDSAGPSSGAYVSDSGADKVLFERRAGDRRAIASNAKLFTTAAALAELGARRTLPTSALADGAIGPDGTLDGDLYLRGGGDPTFGNESFARDVNSDATVGALVEGVADAGVERVDGRVIGDESLFDSLRGGPASNGNPSPFVGTLSALIYNRGFTGKDRDDFQGDPPEFAAKRFTRKLEGEGIEVGGGTRVGTAPNDAEAVAAVASPQVAVLVRQINKPSDNFTAEMLVKRLGVGAKGEGSTSAGSRASERYAREFDARPRIVDGSGLSRRNKASPRSVVRLLEGQVREDHFDPFLDSLPIAGEDGTLHERMRGEPAEGRCSAKTGTLPGVSTLSGYCRSRDGDRLVFSWLMNGVDTSAARELQDRMTNALARYRG